MCPRLWMREGRGFYFVPFLLLGEGALKGEGEVQGQVACGSQRHIPCEPTHQSCFAAYFFLSRSVACRTRISAEQRHAPRRSSESPPSPEPILHDNRRVEGGAPPVRARVKLSLLCISANNTFPFRSYGINVATKKSNIELAKVRSTLTFVFIII